MKNKKYIYWLFLGPVIGFFLYYLIYIFYLEINFSFSWLFMVLFGLFGLLISDKAYREKYEEEKKINSVSPSNEKRRFSCFRVLVALFFIIAIPIIYFLYIGPLIERIKKNNEVKKVLKTLENDYKDAFDGFEFREVNYEPNEICGLLGCTTQDNYKLTYILEKDDSIKYNVKIFGSDMSINKAKINTDFEKLSLKERESFLNALSRDFEDKIFEDTLFGGTNENNGFIVSIKQWSGAFHWQDYEDIITSNLEEYAIPNNFYQCKTSQECNLPNYSYSPNNYYTSLDIDRYYMIDRSTYYYNDVENEDWLLFEK